MTAAARPPHAVLLREPARFDAKAVAALLARRSSLPAESLLPVVRRAWGVQGEPSPAEDAEALAKDLEAAGFAAAAVPVSLLEPVPAPTAVTKAALGGDGFDVEAGKAGAARERLTWTHLKVLSAGFVTGSSTKTVVEGPSMAEKATRLGLTVATGLPLMGGKEKTRRVTQETRAPFVDLVFSDPARRVRVMGAEFDYAALGAKMGYSADLNFRALVAELAARAPGCLRSKGARGVLAKAPSGELAYDSFEDVEREERWLQALAALGLAA